MINKINKYDSNKLKRSRFSNRNAKSRGFYFEKLIKLLTTILTRKKNPYQQNNK